MDSADKERLRKAGRAAIVTVSNLTSVDLTRSSFTLNNGLWFKFPPERIAANSSATFATQSTGVLRGTEGSIELQFFEDQVPIKLSWDVPYFGSSKTDHACPGSITIEKTEKLGNFTEVHFAITDPLDGLLMRAPESTSQISSDAVERWKSDLKKANNSLMITIHNTTEFTLHLKDHDIQRGNWKVFPPEAVESGSKVQFAAESQNIVGSLGNLSYLVDTVRGDQIVQHTLPFSWTFSLIGKPQFKHKIWSMSSETEHDGHYEIELSLSSDESFVLETNFVKIEAPTFDVVLEETGEGIRLDFLDDQGDPALVASPDGSAYPVQLDLLD